MFGGNNFGGGNNPFSGGGFGDGSMTGGFPSGSENDMENPEDTTNDAAYNYNFGGNDQGDDGSGMMDQFSRSPFGRLLDLPGIEGPEDIFGNLGGGEGGNPFGGDMSGGGMGGGNPFANFNPLEDGNPFVEGDEPEADFSGGEGGGNPFAEGGSPFGGGSSSMSNGAEGGDGGETGEADNSDMLDLLARSPFGVLLDIPGFEVDSAEDIFGNLGGGEGENPFGGDMSGGNPFANFNPLEDGNPFLEGDEPDLEFPDGTGSFADGEIPAADPVSVGNNDSGYLVSDDEGNWYLSEDTSVDESDQQLGANPFAEGEFNFPDNIPSGDFLTGEDVAVGTDDGSYEFDFSQVDGVYDFSETEELFGGENSPFSGDGENPFAGGFGSGSEVESENPNPFAGGSNPFAGGENPFAGGGNPFA